MKQLELLLEYQKLDIKIGRIEDKVRKSALYKKVVKVRKYLLDSQKVMQRHEIEVTEMSKGLKVLLSQYNECSETIDELDSAIENVDVESSIKEAQMLVRKANEEKTKLVRLEKEILKEQKHITSIEESIQKIATNAPKYKTEFEQLKEKYDEELKIVTTETAPMKKELKTFAKDIDKEVLKRYKGVRKSHPIAVVMLDGKRCMGCNMELSSGMAKKVSMSEDLIECENCGRLLYTKSE